MTKFENKFFFSNTLTYTILFLLVGRMEYLSIWYLDAYKPSSMLEQVPNFSYNLLRIILKV